ncbi:hypothetical protein [Halobacillus litoralis]|uniref:hypothetical protein n=1 Tax=Halobacillus litoralis TaxID=45668 RepID=UPI001CD80948|nr:hypothetical protein [Halobacillus litoralis]MCA1021525.1 hypothetical protein [Halobacillus litoralis]
MRESVTIKYKLGHKYTFDYDKSALYCPNCGKQEVWIEAGEGDYYQGSVHCCTNCRNSFTMPSFGKDDSYEGRQLFDQLS